MAERAAGARLVQEELSGLASAVERMMALDVARSYEPPSYERRRTRVERKGADR